MVDLLGRIICTELIECFQIRKMTNLIIKNFCSLVFGFNQINQSNQNMKQNACFFSNLIFHWKKLFIDFRIKNQKKKQQQQTKLPIFIY